MQSGETGSVMSMTKFIFFCMLLPAFFGTSLFVQVHAKPDLVLSITVTSDKRTYNYREPIKLLGNFIQNGLPVSNGTVGVAVYENSSSLPIAFRALRTGPTSLKSLVDLVDLAPCDATGVTMNSLMPQQHLYVKFTFKSYDSIDHERALTTITVFDANGIPLATRTSLDTIRAGATETTIFNTGWEVPVSAQPGNATIVACIFTGSPIDGGVPYGQEKKASFEIKRNPEIGYSTPPMTDPPAPDGSFATSLKLTNELRPGDYQVHVSAQSTITNDTQQSLQKANATTFFSIINAIMPPQAAFTYYPVDSYLNMSITFDASASTAEGYNVSIMSYTWDFGDGSPQWTNATSTVIHTYTGANNYTVTLKVTDSQGLWSTTSKIVAILPPAGPEANFIWYPATPKKNQQVTFDATLSKPGWNGTDHPPIINYIWDFGDGNVTSGDYLDKAFHMYVTEGDYTVKLNVTDASGFKGYSASTDMVRVSGVTGDINGDGVVDIYDAIVLAGAYNSKPGDSNWNPNADINGDNIVDIYDAITLANNYGKTA
jgi:PKD repeat protein